MKRTITETLRRTFDVFPQNLVLLLAGTISLILPLIATTGQYLNTGYFFKSTPVLLLFWPGSEFKLSISIQVWVFMSLVFISYLAGIAYMLNRRTLGKVILITISGFIFSGLLRALLSGIFGWQESPLPDLTGRADAAILSQWHNPVWEEIVFRGIPLLILLAVERYITKKRTIAGVLIFLIVPSVIFGFYHIPGHGMIRFFDTIILGILFGWLALEYTFFAPVVMHYVADAMLVLNLNKIPTIQPSEVEWITMYGSSLNTFFSLSVLLMLVLVPILIIYHFMRFRKQIQPA